MPFKGIRDMLAFLISKNQFCATVFTSTPTVYTMVCTECKAQFRNTGYGLAECPECHKLDTLIPDPACPKFLTKLDINSKIGIQLRYNPRYLEELARNLVHFHAVVSREAYYIILGHPQRQLELLRNAQETLHGRGLESQIIFTKASDFVVNPLLLRQYNPGVAGRLSEKIGFLPAKEGASQGQIMDEYLSWVTRHAEKNPALYTKDPLEDSLVGLHDLRVEDIDGLSEKLDEAATDEERSALLASLLISLQIVLTEDLPRYLVALSDEFKSRARGSLPAGLKDALEKLQLPKEIPPWHRLLSSAVARGEKIAKKRDWSRFNRRKAGLDLLMPGPHKFLAPGSRAIRDFRIGVIVDSSGSMSTADLQVGLGTIKTIRDQRPSSTLWVAYADTQIYGGSHPSGLAIHLVTNEKDIVSLLRRCVGRGGTDFRKPLEQFIPAVDPDILVYFTDGHGLAPRNPPSRFLGRGTLPIVWCVPKSGKIPATYGEFIWIH